MHIRYNCHIVKHNINNNEIISGYTLSAILAITNKYHILIKISGWKIRFKHWLLVQRVCLWLNAEIQGLH